MTLIINSSRQDDSIRPNVIIKNARSSLTGIAVDHGFTDSGRKAFVRWSATAESGYTDWHEIKITSALRNEYLNAIDFWL